MGCTTSLQAIVASTPVIEVQHDMTSDTLDSANQGYAHNYTQLFCQNEVELSDCLVSAAKTPHNSFRNLDTLKLNWHNCFESNTSFLFPNIFMNLVVNVTRHHFQIILNILRLQEFRQKSRLAVINWIVPRFHMLKGAVRYF